jgi:hypothetical protein
MSALLIVPPLRVSSVTTSRGSGAQNLISVHPREVWEDSAVGQAHVVISVDLGQPRTIDTVYLGSVHAPSAETSWAIVGRFSAASQNEELRPWGPLRVPDVPGYFPAISCGLWFGAARTVRYLDIYVRQPAGDPLTIGTLIVGKAFSPQLGKEWGWGRRPIDTGSATPLSSGGFATVPGTRKRYMGWTFGDLTKSETDQIDMIALEYGDTKPLLIVDDPTLSDGLWLRILYGKFERWRPFERRNGVQTKWEIGFEEWR